MQENVQLQFEENSHIEYLPNSDLIKVDYEDECKNPLGNLEKRALLKIKHILKKSN